MKFTVYLPPAAESKKVGAWEGFLLQIGGVDALVLDKTRSNTDAYV